MSMKRLNYQQQLCYCINKFLFNFIIPTLCLWFLHIHGGKMYNKNFENRTIVRR
jgi:hypothetical protein